MGSCRLDFSQDKQDKKLNWVLANFIGIDFADKQISSLEAENTVSYRYHQEKTEERDFFVNTADGDFLEAKFNENNKLEFMKMRQKIKGIYKFHNKS